MGVAEILWDGGVKNIGGVPDVNPLLIRGTYIVAIICLIFKVLHFYNFIYYYLLYFGEVFAVRE